MQLNAVAIVVSAKMEDDEFPDMDEGAEAFFCCCCCCCLRDAAGFGGGESS